MRSMILFFLVLGAWANSTPFLTKDELKQMSSTQIQVLRMSYIKFLIQVENDVIFNLKDSPSKRTSFLQHIKIFEEAKAALNGQGCFFGGWQSKIENGFCVHPRKTQPAYQECPGGKFRCDQHLFGKDTCVAPQNPRFGNLTNDCFEASKDKFNPDDLVNNEDLQNKLRRLQAGATQFCNANPDYDACDALQRRVREVRGVAPEDIEDQLSSINEDLEGINNDGGPKQSECDPRSNLSSTCPATTNKALIGHSHGGAYEGFQVIRSKISGTEHASTPKEFCAQYVNPEEYFQSPGDLAKLVNSDQGRELGFLPGNFHETSTSCVGSYSQFRAKKWIKFDDTTLGNRGANLAKTFAVADLAIKDRKLSMASLNLQAGITEMDFILNNKTDIDCKSSPYTATQMDCLSAKSCEGDTEFSILNQYLRITKELLVEKRKAENGDDSQTLKDIKDSAPWIEHGDIRLKDYLDKDGSFNESNSEKLKAAISKGLHNIRAELKEKLDQVSLASNCLRNSQGVDKGCENIDKTLDEHAYLDPDPSLIEEPQMKSIFQYHQCVEDKTDSIEGINDIVQDIAITSALMVTPMGVAGLARGLYSAGKIGGKLARRGALALNAATAGADLYYGHHLFNETHESCSGYNTIQPEKEEKLSSCSKIGRAAAVAAVNRSCALEYIGASVGVIFPMVSLLRYGKSAHQIRAYSELEKASDLKALPAPSDFTPSGVLRKPADKFNDMIVAAPKKPKKFLQEGAQTFISRGGDELEEAYIKSINGNRVTVQTKTGLKELEIGDLTQVVKDFSKIKKGSEVVFKRPGAYNTKGRVVSREGDKFVIEYLDNGAVTQITRGIKDILSSTGVNLYKQGTKVRTGFPRFITGEIDKVDEVYAYIKTKKGKIKKVALEKVKPIGHSNLSISKARLKEAETGWKDIKGNTQNSPYNTKAPLDDYGVKFRDSNAALEALDIIGLKNPQSVKEIRKVLIETANQMRNDSEKYIRFRDAAMYLTKNFPQ